VNDLTTPPLEDLEQRVAKCTHGRRRKVCSRHHRLLMTLRDEGSQGLCTVHSWDEVIGVGMESGHRDTANRMLGLSAGRQIRLVNDTAVIWRDN
jgi:hypothetical protein